jgi:diguanylate cyclase (GGDEF)-like protein
MREQLTYLISSLLSQNQRFRLLVLYSNTSSQQSAIDLEKLLPENHPDYKHYHLKSDLTEPYFPFLRYLPASIEDFNYYTAHREIWKTFYENKIVSREEEILPGEFAYENLRMQETIADTVQEFSQPNELIYISNAHHLTDSSIRVLESLHKRNLSQFYILSMTAEADSELLERIIRLAEDSGAVLQSDDSLEMKRKPAAKTLLKGNVIEKARSCLHFMDYVSVLNLLGQIHEPDRDFAYFQLLGKVSHAQGRLENALQWFQSALNKAQESTSEKKIAEAYIELGRIYLEREDLDHSEYMLRLAVKLGESSRDRRSVFYGHFMLFQIEDKRRWRSPEEFKSYYFDLLERAEQLGFIFSYIYISVNPFGLYSDYDSEIYNQHQKGIDLCINVDNKYRLAFSYQTIGMANAVLGKYKEVINYYKKTLEITEELDSPLELAYAHNGVGFFNYLIGNYAKAQEHYIQALDNLSSGEDMHEIGMTLFNMGMNSMLARRASQSVEYFESCIQLLDRLGRGNLSYHSELGILVVYGIACLNSGKWAKAWQIGIEIEQKNLKPIEKKNEEFFMLNLFKALLEEQKKNLSLVEEYFAAAEEYLEKTNDNIQYFAPFYFFEKSRYFERIKDKKKAEEIELQLKEACSNHGNKFYTTLIDNEKSESKSSTKAWKHKPDLYWIIQAAEKEQQLSKLYSRMEELHFLKDIQEFFSLCSDENELIQRLVDRVFINLNVEGCYFYSREPHHKTESLMYHRSTDPYAEADPGKGSMERKQQLRYFPISGQQRDHGTLVMDFGKNISISDERLQLFTIISTQLSLAMDRIVQMKLIARQNEELKRSNQFLQKMSLTDPLTGVGNRKALEETLKHYTGLQKRKPKQVVFSLLFMDFDNFKYINDLFGHERGDQVLIKATQTINSTMRESDALFRYGGDEFVLVLSDTDREGAEIVAKKLIDFLHADKLLPDDHLTVLEDYQKLSVSIGIVDAQHLETSQISPESVLEKADSELYKVKKAGKKGFSSFGSIAN